MGKGRRQGAAGAENGLVIVSRSLTIMPCGMSSGPQGIALGRNGRGHDEGDIDREAVALGEAKAGPVEVLRHRPEVVHRLKIIDEIRRAGGDKDLLRRRTLTAHWPTRLRNALMHPAQTPTVSAA